MNRNVTLSDKACNEFHKNKFSVREDFEQVYLGKDVKQFVNEIKNDCCPRTWITNAFCNVCDICKAINKRAGKEFV